MSEQRISNERWPKQTRLHDDAKGTKGNCTQAAIAGLLGLKLDDVPDFNALYDSPSDYWDAIHAFFIERGFELVCINSDRGGEALHLASGKSPRGTHHMVIRREHAIVSDPHPSGNGLAETTRVWLPVPLDAGAIITTNAESAALKAENARLVAERAGVSEAMVERAVNAAHGFVVPWIARDMLEAALATPSSAPLDPATIRAEALEEAAKIAEQEIVQTYVEYEGDRGCWREGLRPKWDRGPDIAAAIRAAKETGR